MVWELKFGTWVLLQPERINACAQAVIQTLRADEDERGCIAEERVLDGDLTYHRPQERLPVDEERFVQLVSRLCGLCVLLRQIEPAFLCGCSRLAVSLRCATS